MWMQGLRLRAPRTGLKRIFRAFSKSSSPREQNAAGIPRYVAAEETWLEVRIEQVFLYQPVLLETIG